MRPARLACLAVALAGVACESRPSFDARKTTLVVLPFAWRRPSIHVADDGRHVTFSVRVRNGYRVVTPEGRGPTFRDVGPPLFAPESTRVFYWAARDEDGRRRIDVVAGGAVVRTPLAAVTELVTAPGGRRWAALGPVADGDTGTPPVAVVVDGREIGRWAAVSRPTFTRDGARVAWVAQATTGEASLVVDGAVTRTFPPTAASPGGRFEQLAAVRWLSDGRLLALVPDGAAWTLLRNDERLATYGQNLAPGGTLVLGGPETTSAIVGGSLATAADAPVAAWWERMPGAAGRWRVVRDGAAVDGMVCARYWDAQPPVLSDDGVHVAYVCPAAIEPDAPLGRRWTVLDGRRFGPYMESWTLGLSPDGTQLAHGAAERLPVMSWRIFVNGTPRTPPVDLVWRPRFSSDGARVLWAGGPERGRKRLAVDGRTVTRFDDLVYGPELAGAHGATWVIRRGRKLSRVEVVF